MIQLVRKEEKSYDGFKSNFLHFGVSLRSFCRSDRHFFRMVVPRSRRSGLHLRLFDGCREKRISPPEKARTHRLYEYGRGKRKNQRTERRKPRNEIIIYNKV